MLHFNRRFCVVPEESDEVLARKLTEQIWTGCTGFRHARYLFLNDSFSPDQAQEYAVFHMPEPPGKPFQIESVTFGWMNATEALTLIRDIVRGKYDDVMHVEHDLTLETPKQHGRCPQCA